MNPLVPIVTANIKHSPTPSHININPHTKVLFTLFLLADIMCQAFKKFMRNSKKKQTEKTAQSSKPNSVMTVMLGLSDRKFKINMINS